MALLGAINKLTGEYIHPFFANKNDEYVCPECNRDLILCKGEKRIHHYRHKTDSAIPCNHYSNPGEAQIHKDAKRLIKSMLERKIPFSIVRKCVSCDTSEEFDIPEIDETSKIILEYRFEYNGLKIADVAYIENDEIVCIFEICNTHKTCSEDRPEPWFEIDARTLIDTVSNNNTVLKIPCIRCEKCYNCKKKEEYEKERQNFILENLKKIKIERQIRENEQEQEKYELLSMGKEDQRTIEKLLLMKRIEEEIQKQIEEEREFERKKREEEREKRLEEEREIKRKIIEKELELELIKQKNYENKSRAVDILYNWFNNSKSISPFYVDEEKYFLCVKKNIKLSYTHKAVDLILYEEDIQSEEGRYEKYNLFLVNNVSEWVFKNRYYNSEFGIRVYFINIGWVLSQTEIPNKIEYIASIDNFDIGKNRYLDCVRCKYDTEFWVKRLFTKTDYKIINISICCGRRESEYVECERCGSLDTPLSEMEKNGEMLCKSCII